MIDAEDVLGFLLIVFVIVAIFAAAVLLQGLFFWWAWNLFVAAVFHGPHITFVQSIAGSFLLNTLVTGMHFLTGGFFRKVD